MKPSLEEFLKCKKVKCVKAHYNSLTVGKEYSVLNIRIGVEVIDNEGSKYYWRANHFEPVLDSAENPLQGVELTPEFEAVEPKFKAGDKVYIPNIKNICTIRDDGKVITSNGQHYCDLSDSYDLCFVLATPENHALLSKLYPHIEFEQPPKPDAVERPMTLIEKLEQVIVEHNTEFNKIIKDATDHQKIAHTAVLAGLLSAIKVAKQHQTWRKMPSD